MPSPIPSPLRSGLFDGGDGDPGAGAAAPFRFASGPSRVTGDLVLPETDESEPPLVVLHSDGGASPNPGPGGWAFVVEVPETGSVVEGAGCESRSTNNRMEMIALIHGLAILPRGCRVRFRSDSQILVKGITEWKAGWKRRGWKTASKKPVENQDLWLEIDRLEGIHRIDAEWVRGHAGDPGNERCDALVNEARRWLRGGAP